MRPLPTAMRAALVVVGVVLSLSLLCATLIALDIGDPNALTLARRTLMWFFVPPLVVAIVLLGGLRSAPGRWHVLGAVLCGLGDGLGAWTGETAVLLGFTAAGLLAYVASLWPTRRVSLGWGFGGFAYAAVALSGSAVIAANAGPLAIPVVVYAFILAAVAGLAATNTAGFIGGLLFLASDLALGLALFVLEVPDPLRAFIVLTTYALAQSLLAISLVWRLPESEAALSATTSATTSTAR